MIAEVAVGAVAGAIVLVYLALKPPPPKPCASPFTSTRVKLSDGRHLAYREAGVAKEKAKFKIIVVHGFDSNKDQMSFPVSKEFVEELGLYFVFFDRAGYGESDPNPKRTVKSESLDIQELADKLDIGTKFYVLGVSMGGYPVWSCLYYIPHRLAGAALVVPFVNFWWPSLPANISNEAIKKLHPQFRWTIQVARYAPWLLYLWMTQRLIPSLSILWGNFPLNSKKDLELLNQFSKANDIGQKKVRHHGVHESACRDILVGFSKWEFDPTDVSNPFPNNEGSVHIWQGFEDKIIPVQINRYISQKLPWIIYHELADHGHHILSSPSVCRTVLRKLVMHK